MLSAESWLLRDTAPAAKPSGGIDLATYLLGDRQQQTASAARAEPVARSPPSVRSPVAAQQRRTPARRQSAPKRRSAAGQRGSVAERSAVWSARREQRLARERQHKELSRLDGCSFVPFTNASAQPRTDAAARRNPPGYSSFVDRYRSARAEQEAARARADNDVFATGDGWTGEPTVPISPRFCRRERERQAERQRYLAPRPRTGWPWPVHRDPSGRAQYLVTETGGSESESESDFA
eukprot:TRINITY_DN15772_c0_g1_i1.p1 TRINITY_DN15772_c0_g1~~TRINITY_DN15772_c0_g1_i1.p1  ORF type:complete len:257 (+),score=42.27 TRINITY_DN15772_c0_g1_i1:63-773(+)